MAGDDGDDDDNDDDDDDNEFITKALNPLFSHYLLKLKTQI